MPEATDGWGPARITTKKEAALRQISVAIRVLIDGEYEAAITLACAAEGMIAGTAPDPGLLLSFEVLKARKPDDIATDKEWIAVLNSSRDWLKHPSGGDQHEIGQFRAWLMLVRALSKYQAIYRDGTDEVERLFTWARDHYKAERAG